MGKSRKQTQKPKSESLTLTEALEKAGIKVTSVGMGSSLDPRQVKALAKFIKEIEDAHKRAEKSKLVFKHSAVPADYELTESQIRELSKIFKPPTKKDLQRLFSSRMPELMPAKKTKSRKG